MRNSNNKQHPISYHHHYQPPYPTTNPHILLNTHINTPLQQV